MPNGRHLHRLIAVAALAVLVTDTAVVARGPSPLGADAVAEADVQNTNGAPDSSATGETTDADPGDADAASGATPGAGNPGELGNANAVTGQGGNTPATGSTAGTTPTVPGADGTSPVAATDAPGAPPGSTTPGSSPSVPASSPSPGNAPGATQPSPTTSPAPPSSTADPSAEPTQPTTPAPPSSPAGADRVLSGDVVLSEGFTVPAGQRWVFDPAVTTTVTVAANVIVEGVLELKPSSRAVVHTLQFTGIDETKIVGGHTDTPLATDVGMWVIGDGQLLAQGTPTAGWNRTGTDPTWQTGDDIRVTPQTLGDWTNFPTFTPGSAVPTVTGPDGSVHPAEVFNLTRNVRILGGGGNAKNPMADSGRAHIQFLHCNKPQTISDVELRWLGPRRSTSDGSQGVTGRYALHFHKCGDAARGSTIDRVVVRDAGGHAFVPHASHGITFRDTIAYDVFESAYWWDPGADNATNNVTYDHAAAFAVTDAPAKRAFTLAGFELGRGTDNTVTNSVVAGALGTSVNAGGFLWPSQANHSKSAWTFTDNVAHNNRAAGIGVWQNDFGDHTLSRFTSYRNDEGMHLGSYLNSYHYQDGLSFDEDVIIRALGTTRFDRLTIGGNIRLRDHKLATDLISRFTDLTLYGRIIVDEATNGGVFEFISTAPRYDITPDHFTIRNQLSRISTTTSNGATRTIT